MTVGLAVFSKAYFSLCLAIFHGLILMLVNRVYGSHWKNLSDCQMDVSSFHTTHIINKMELT